MHLLPFCQKSGAHWCVELYLNLNSITLIHVSVFNAIVPFFYYYGSVVQLEMWGGDLSNIAIKQLLMAYCYTHRSCITQHSAEKLLLEIDGN